jgi:hypothetical protein
MHSNLLLLITNPIFYNCSFDFDLKDKKQVKENLGIIKESLLDYLDSILVELGRDKDYLDDTFMYEAGTICNIEDKLNIIKNYKKTIYNL